MQCTWSYEIDGYYNTGCMEAHQFETGNIVDNKFKYCPYCGGKIFESEE